MDKRIKELFTITVFAIMPLLTCLVMCMKDGVLLKDIFIANSKWNDELLYYKLVEGTIEYGQPLGCFGYNGSFAKIGHFGAWSPIVLMFYIIYAFIFGWGMMSPIYCNIMLITIAMIIFAWLVKPTKRQTVYICLLFFCNGIVSRYMLSVMTEVAIYTLLLIFLAVSIRMFRQKQEFKKSYIIALNVLAGILILMRPYWLLLMIIPGYYVYSRFKRKSFVLAECGISIVIVAIYFWINHNMSAAYFTSIIDFEWLKLLLNKPISGLYNILHMFVTSGYGILKNVGDGVVNGAVYGGIYAVFFVLTIYLLYMLTNHTSKKTEKIGLIYWLAYFGIMLLAIIYLYDVNMGSRHIIGFIFISMFIIALIETSTKRLSVILFAFVWIFCIRGACVSTYNVPIYTEEKAKILQAGETALEEKIILDENADNAWDNTVIWLYSDNTIVDFTHLYALPAGVGINLCTKEYVIANFDELQSRYIVTNIGEEVDLLCQDSEKELLAEYGTVHVWKLR